MDHIILPSNLQVDQVVTVQFRQDMPPMTATVIGVRFGHRKVKYDLAIWLEDDSSTRIYNVDSFFVKPK